MKKIKKKNLILLVISIICIIILIISLINIFGWFKDNKQIDDEIQTLDNININEVDDSNNTIIINNNVKKDDLYWKYINTKLIKLLDGYNYLVLILTIHLFNLVIMNII